MEVSVNIGQNYKYVQSEALIIYKQDSRSGSSSFVTYHKIIPGDTPTFGPAKPLTRKFLQLLSKALGRDSGMEILPENVIARSSDQIAWWVPQQKRAMFFDNAQGIMKEMNGKIFPQPALVFFASRGRLNVRAIESNVRPSAKTPMCVASYWNVYVSGDICLGSAKTPNAANVASIPGWEKAFYDNAYTHPNDEHLTSHAGGFEGLWTELAGQAEFPSHYLLPAHETLAQFLKDQNAD
jgi:PRTRC genetic system protein B